MAAQPGWYPVENTDTFMWWNGYGWEPDHPRTEEEKTHGVVVYRITEGEKSAAKLVVHEFEVWRYPAKGAGPVLGGLIAGAHAEVIIQNQVGRRRWAGLTVLHVTGEGYDFAFGLEKKSSQSQHYLNLMNDAASFINRRSRALSPAVPESLAGQSAVSVADELVKLAGLRESGILTDDEFAAQKARLLS